MIARKSLRSFSTGTAARPAARAVFRVRAEAEEKAPTSEATIFYGGKSYTETEFTAAANSGSFIKTDVQAAAPMSTTNAASSTTISDVMAFSGAAPEITNGRLAMLGFVAALGAELASGEGVARQWAEEPAGICAAFALFIAASLVPMLSGQANFDEIGPFNRKAELTNGRAAMIGFAALIAIEAIKGSALF